MVGDGWYGYFTDEKPDFFFIDAGELVFVIGSEDNLAEEGMRYWLTNF